MEQSPLTQQARPDVFEPKVAKSYRELFRNPEDDEKPEGFWKEFFLLRPDLRRLGQILDDTDADYLLQTQHHSQQLLVYAISTLKSGAGPADEHALDTLTVFFAKVLSKRYTNPSSDIIGVLAGLDNVDTVFTDLVATLDGAIKAGRTINVRTKAVKVALCVTSGAFQTGLLTYFVHRDLFPSLMKLIHDTGLMVDAIQPFLLAGLLANHNKFEARNPYHVRFADFVNEDIIRKTISCIGDVSLSLRDNYVAILDDTPQAWSVGNTLSYIGLGALTGAKPAAPVLTEEEQKVRFSEQPKPEAAMLLAVYDFVLANKIFCLEFVTSQPSTKQEQSSFASFLSFASYLYQHAHRSVRATHYAHTTLFILQMLVEDPAIAKRLCEINASVRLSRQRAPYLPLAKGDRTLSAAILDMMIDSINHNLRKKLDVDLYLLNLGIIHRLLTFLSRSRASLPYHWPELWRSLLSFVRFLTTYAEDLKQNYGTDKLVHDVVNLITLSLTEGEGFLPESNAYDDLFYKLVETGDSLAKFRDAYNLDKTESAASIAVLVGVSRHYTDLIQQAKGKTKNLSPREVNQIIKQGYETLSIEAKEGLDHWDKYREADHKVELKKIARTVVADAAVLSTSST